MAEQKAGAEDVDPIPTRSALMAYVEWRTRIAVAKSQPGAAAPPRAPVPHGCWGEAPPFVADGPESE